MACLEFQMVVKKEDYATIWVPKICVFQELRLWIELARSIAKLICKRNITMPENEQSHNWKSFFRALEGSSIPSAFLLWVMRKEPPLITAYVQQESATLTFVSDSTAAIPNPKHWMTAPSVRNQAVCFALTGIGSSFHAQASVVLAFGYCVTSGHQLQRLT